MSKMFVDENDKTIVFHPEASKTIMTWLTEVEYALREHPETVSSREAVTRLRALSQVLSTGFGKAARVTPDTPEGSLFVAEYRSADDTTNPYVFGCVKHANNQIGVHS